MGRDPRERVVEAASDRDRGVGEARRRGEPVGRGDIERDGCGTHSRRNFTVPRIVRIRAERRDELPAPWPSPVRAFTESWSVGRPNIVARPMPRILNASCTGDIHAASRQPEFAARSGDQADRGFICAPEIGPSIVINTTKIAPVGSVLPSSARARPFVQACSAMMPEPTHAGATSEEGAQALRRDAADRASLCPFRSFARGLATSMRPISRSFDCRAQSLTSFEGQREEYPDAHGRHAVCFVEDRGDTHWAALFALDRGRILNPPMRRHRLTRPDRAGFAGRVVANREDEIERRRALLRELVPILRTITLGRKAHLAEQPKRFGMNSRPLGGCPPKRRKRPAPSLLRIASARIDRALFPVHRNRRCRVARSCSFNSGVRCSGRRSSGCRQVCRAQDCHRRWSLRRR